MNRKAVRVSGILLAAGRSVRFGDAPKQLALFDGKPLVRRAAETLLASQVDEVVVVVGHRSREVRSALDGLTLRVVDNPDFADGQSTSIRRGLEAVDGDALAAVMMMADQPRLTTALIDRLIDRFLQDSRRDSSGDPPRDSSRDRPLAVRPVHAGKPGSPVVIARQLFGVLCSLKGDEGGRSILRAHAQEVIDVEVDDATTLFDVDSRQDLIDLGP